MNNKLKYSMIFGSAIMNLAFGFTNPTMVIYFTSRVDPGIYAIANMITLGLGAIVNNSINIDRIMKIYKQYFVYIVIRREENMICSWHIPAISGLLIQYIMQPESRMGRSAILERITAWVLH